VGAGEGREVGEGDEGDGEWKQGEESKGGVRKGVRGGGEGAEEGKEEKGAGEGRGDR